MSRALLPRQYAQEYGLTPHYVRQLFLSGKVRRWHYAGRLFLAGSTCGESRPPVLSGVANEESRTGYYPRAARESLASAFRSAKDITMSVRHEMPGGNPGSNGHSTAAVKPEQRFTHGRSCPICGGDEDSRRGQGERCFGFRSDDGEWAHCTRPEHAGLATVHAFTQAYAHRLKGKCPCGTEHAPADPKPKRTTRGLGTPVATYHYHDTSGRLLFDVVRFANPKTFRQRRVGPDGKPIWNLNGIEPVLYHLPKLLAADPAQVVHVVEGEKDVESLEAIGCLATCNPMGAEKWRDAYSEHLRGRSVVILPDNDDRGRTHAQDVARSVHGKAATLKVLELPGLPEKGDVTDWIRAGGSIEELERLVGNATFWESADRRPKIWVTTEEHEVNDLAVGALANDPDVFRRGPMLVTVVRDDTPAGVITRAGGSVRITSIVPAVLRERMTRSSEWWRATKKDNGDFEPVRTHPPDWCVKAVHARGQWPQIRRLEAVVETPTLRPDGSVIDKPGYDRKTGVLYLPNAQYPEIPSRPTLVQAQEAAAELLDLAIDFPFADECHRAAWLAGLLTPIARFAIDGACPLFLIDSPVAGSGKSKLCDLASVVATGREMARTNYSQADAEMVKVITSVVLAGDRAVLFDNVEGTLGNAPLDAALTARTWKERILGRSEMTPDLPLDVVFYATGINTALGATIVRRIVPCRVQPTVERPEERTGFKYPNVLAIAKARRPELVAAALTVLRAYFVAGRPNMGMTEFGSYEAWSSVVRGAVAWTLDYDPCATREELRMADAKLTTAVSLIEGWAELPDSDRGLTVAEAIKFVESNPILYQKLHEAFTGWSRSGMPSARSVGNHLKKYRGRVVGRKVFELDPLQKIQLWRVRSLD